MGEINILINTFERKHFYVALKSYPVFFVYQQNIVFTFIKNNIFHIIFLQTVIAS